MAFVEDGADDLGAFLDRVHSRSPARRSCISTRPAHVLLAEGRWLHCASTETLTFYALHDRRGTEGIDHTGVMPRFRGTAVHDGWPQYRFYTDVTHALCNAHHLRELLVVIEQHPETQPWARQIDALLRALHEEVKAAKAAGEDWLDPSVLASYRAAYQQIIANGNHDNPPGTIPTGKRDVIKQTPARNLLTRAWTATASRSCASPTNSKYHSTTTPSSVTSE
jgi:hypothetical protein